MFYESVIFKNKVCIGLARGTFYIRSGAKKKCQNWDENLILQNENVVWIFPNLEIFLMKHYLKNKDQSFSKFW